MANLGKLVRVMCRAASDGQASSFELNLISDPYWLGQAQPGGIGGRLCNWFAERSGPAPTGVVAVDGATSASLDINGFYLTIGVPVKPAGAVHHVTLDLTFA